MPAESVTDKLITLPISRFADYLIGTADKRYHINPDDATVLALKDIDEVFVHVEFPDRDNQLTEPCVWRAKEWRSTYEKYQRNKAAAEQERKAANIFRENVERVVKKLTALTGLDSDRCRNTAVAIVRRAKKEELVKIGITVEEWDKNFNLDYIK